MDVSPPNYRVPYMTKDDTPRCIHKMRKGLDRVFRVIIVFAFLWQGCSGIDPQYKDIDQRRPLQEVRFFEELDAAVTASSVQEVSTFAVEGFPYLRTTRFLAAMKDRVNTDSEAEAWLTEMHRLGREARKKEIINLPEASFRKLAERMGVNPDRTAMIEEMFDSAVRLQAYDRSHPQFFERLRNTVNVPDEYSSAMRVFGLYPFTVLPVAIASRNAKRKFSKWHQTSLEDLPVEGKLVVFGPEAGNTLTDSDLVRIFSPSGHNAIDLPNLNDKEIISLAHAFAPVITQDVVAAYDRFGEVEWQKGRVAINPQQASVYYYVTYSFINQIPVVQINYAFWYSERSGKKSPGYEKGPLDGITVRVSLNPTGRPVMVDIMNNCGCYHFYAPRKGMVTIKKPSSDALYPFVATWLADRFPQRRLTLRVNSGWHQVEHLYAGEAPPGSATYRLVPYDLLESLPHSDGQAESVFDSEGIMKNSWRVEPFLLFSMGIPHIGYMRQRGHHAIHIVGRAHFTDPNIFDRYFAFRQ